MTESCRQRIVPFGSGAELTWVRYAPSAENQAIWISVVPVAWSPFEWTAARNVRFSLVMPTTGSASNEGQHDFPPAVAVSSSAGAGALEQALDRDK